MGRTETAHAHGFAPMAVYFAAIGAGYMLIEIVVLLRLQLYLGKPVYALSVALFAFLLSSGIGSWVTRRWDDRAAPGVIAFIMPAKHRVNTPRFSNRVQLINEDDAGGMGLGLGEEVSNSRSSNSDEHLDKVRSAEAEEGHLGFACDGLGQQCLASAWGSGQ